VAEPYFAGFVVRRDFCFTLRVSYGFPVKPVLVLLRKHAPETAETQYGRHTTYVIMGSYDIVHLTLREQTYQLNVLTRVCHGHVRDSFRKDPLDATLGRLSKDKIPLMGGSREVMEPL
jgi:hypothetical protein